MWLPQTFAVTARPGPGATWLSKKGRGHRIDYVAWPEHWHAEPGAAGPVQEVDISGGTLDHLLVV
eukprot:9318667-Lingulodinium_polyedra.AAC.1